MRTGKTQKINSIHELRGVAIVMIVFTHCLGVFKNGNLIGNSYLFSFLNLFTFNFTTVFVLIGGFLFQHLSYKFETKTYLVSKMKTIICPYLVVSLCCFFIFYLDELSALPWYSSTTPDIVTTVAKMLLTGKQLLPLWFIPMVAMLYLLSPVLHYWSKKNLIMASIICMFWVIIFPKPDFRQPFLNLLHFGPIYLIGMMIRQNYDIVINAVKSSRSLVVGFFLLCFFIAFIHRYVDDIGVSKIYLDTLQKIVLFLLAIYFLEGINHKVNSGLLYKFFSYMANLSFPIFFLHQIMIISIASLLKQLNFGDLLTTGNGEIAAMGGVFFLISTIGMCVLLSEIVIFIFRNKAKYLIGANR